MEYEEAEDLFGEIDNEGIGYWNQNYGYEGEDKELERLCKEARKALNSLDTHLQTVFDKHELY